MITKNIEQWQGEELAEALSGEMQRLLRIYGEIIDCMNKLHFVQNELERRKLATNSGKKDSDPAS